MTITVPTIKLGFEFHPGADINADCTRCHGGLNEPDGTRFVAVVANVGDPTAGRICESCSDELKPGLWEIAEGLEAVFFGLIHLTEDDEDTCHGAALRISTLVSKLADSIGTNEPWTEAITTN